MSIRQFRPMTAGTRFRSVSGFEEITRDTPGEVAARADEEVGRAETTWGT
jgi:ribosomal protein L2